MLMEFCSESFAFTSLDTEGHGNTFGKRCFSHCDTSVQNTLLYLYTVAITFHTCTNTNTILRFHKRGLFLFCSASSFYGTHNGVLISTYLCFGMLHKQINVRDLKDILYLGLSIEISGSDLSLTSINFIEAAC
jgi:hypothetical protein